MKLDDVHVILATDVGSTTTKARLIMKKDGEYRFVVAGESPTTVEDPFEDVVMGVINSLREIEELYSWKILSENGLIKPYNGDAEGIDLYVSTSSAGGGLQMLCAGVISIITSESARRAALGAGAIVMDTISTDDERLSHEKIEIIRHLRPDMILIAGGTDGGDIKRVSEITEIIVASNPKFRLGDFKIPAVYAGNKEAQEYIKKIIDKNFELTIVDNIRPTLEEENVAPARAAIHELFMEHVMSHAPGYNKLKGLVDTNIMPTPWGEGRMIEEMARKYNCNVLGVGLGGATTNVYSVFDRKFSRTVSANLGMSYSICNVMKETKIRNIIRWIPYEVNEKSIENMIRNKMIRPTTIPQTMKDLIIEHAVAREALRLALEHHKALTVRLRGVHKQKEVSQMFEKEEITMVKMMNLEYIVGTGGLLSHAPKRVQSELILLDGFQPEGVFKMCQDSVFMMPHLGVLSTVHNKAAMEVFEKDCLVWLGTCIAPKGNTKEGNKIATVEVNMPDGTTISEEMKFGTIKKIPLAEGEVANVTIKPIHGFDVGNGKGKIREIEAQGGVVGITLDARGRPLIIPEDSEDRIKKLSKWFIAMNAYSPELLGT